MATLQDYVDILQRSGQAGLEAEVGCPVLVESALTNLASMGERAFRTSYMPPGEEPTGVLRLTERQVFLLQKRGGSAFSGHIGVGRTPNLDVPISRTAISKFHAYFEATPSGAYTLTDKNSTNGTFVDGRRLTPGEPTELNDRSEIRFAAYTFTFMAPETFYAQVEKLTVR